MRERESLYLPSQSYLLDFGNLIPSYSSSPSFSLTHRHSTALHCLGKNLFPSSSHSVGNFSFLRISPALIWMQSEGLPGKMELLHKNIISPKNVYLFLKETNLQLYYVFSKIVATFCKCNSDQYQRINDLSNTQKL